MVDALQAATEGVGAYTVAEAARYARMPVATLNRWFFGHGKHAPLREAGLDGRFGKRITFTDFVEALAIRSLRADYGVRLTTIREAIGNAKERYGINTPFARKDHRTVVIGRELHIFLEEDPENPVGLTGRDLDQKSMRPCIEAYMRDLEFDHDGMARLYRAFTFGDEQVVLDPARSFGEPILRAHGYPAETLWRAAVAEGGFEAAADLYEVPAEAVETAYRYWNQELGLAA